MPAIAVRYWFLSLAVLLPGGVRGQEMASQMGDSTVVAPTYAATQVIYDSAKSTAFWFTSGNMLEVPGAIATEIQAGFLNGVVARVVAGSWGGDGKYAVEYYFQGDSLIFTFESFEYTAEKAPLEQWQNFRRLPGWERRVFWKGEVGVFVESRGRSAELDPAETERLLRNADRLREIMEARARELR